ncbi:L,D-transpeptidase, partial [Streptococcus agalactiae]|uniref:L,D-transpeptidase n=1 Tax=Streptococcus agalactiae TaxID=1311 RepID=UPI00301497CF
MNLSNHTISAYQGAQMLRGPEPMVDGMPGYETIQGTFQIQRKYRFDDMRGEDYFTPDVPFAMYFSGGYAIHGAPWRGSFGYAGPS